MRDWQRIHSEATIVDLHTHPTLKISLFKRNLAKRFRQGLKGFWPMSTRSGFQMLEQGEYDVTLSTVYMPEAGMLKDLPIIHLLRFLRPRSWYRTFGKKSYFKGAVWCMDEIEEQAKQYKGKRPVVVSRSPAELQTDLLNNAICVVHSIEGAHNLQDKCGKIPGEITPEVETEVLANLEYMAKRGVAYLRLSHLYENYCSPSVFPYPDYALKLSKWRNLVQRWDENKGLTPLGEKVVLRARELGMLIDVTHATQMARKQVYDMCQSGIIASHVGGHAINSSTYNLEDWEIATIARNGGVVGVIPMTYWLLGYGKGLGLDAMSQTIRHIISVGGNECVGIGTDLDGLTDPIDEITDASGLSQLTRRLCAETFARGTRYTDETIRKILGGNALRVLTEQWKA